MWGGNEYAKEKLSLGFWVTKIKTDTTWTRFPWCIQGLSCSLIRNSADSALIEWKFCICIQILDAKHIIIISSMNWILNKPFQFHVVEKPIRKYLLFNFFVTFLTFSWLTCCSISNDNYLGFKFILINHYVTARWRLDCVSLILKILRDAFKKKNCWEGDIGPFSFNPLPL